MSPTSYQAAPPRDRLVADALGHSKTLRNLPDTDPVQTEGLAASPTVDLPSHLERPSISCPWPTLPRAPLLFPRLPLVRSARRALPPLPPRPPPLLFPPTPSPSPTTTERC